MLLIHTAQHPTSPSLMPPIKLHQHNQRQSHSQQQQLHRRNISAPAAVVQQVQPTKTPGLLSLSKPSAPQHRAVPNAPAGVRHPTPRQPKSRPQQQHQPTQPQQQQQIGQTPEKAQCGRGTPAKDNKAARNTSKSRAGHGGRARQPSPSPISFPEQAPPPAPAAAAPAAAAADDAAVKSAQPPTSISKATPAPVLNPPSGRLAKRRTRAPIPFPASASAPALAKPKRANTPVKTPPVAVPVSAKNTRSEALPISRSDPVLSHFPRKALRRAETDSIFPVCDDNDSDNDHSDEPPVTPTRPRNTSGSKPVMPTWQQQRSVFDTDGEDLEHELGPRTCPLSSHTEVARFFFPSPVPSPSPSPRRPGHKRTPSFPTDAFFSSAFDSPAASDNELGLSSQPSDMSALYGSIPNRRRAMRPSSMTTPRSKNSSPGVNAFAYASSTFQNSPSPEQLPPPSFSFGAVKDALNQFKN